MSDSTPVGLRFVFFAAATAAIGGFLFGYDTAVINGANSYLNEHLNLNATQQGMATGAALLGCVPGAMFAGFLSDRFGRRNLMFLCAVLFAVSGVLSAIPNTLGEFVAARLIGGLGIGASSMACPVYIAEIAPEKWRGRLGTQYQLGIVVGIFLTLFVNKLIANFGDHAWNVAWGWRWMLGMEVVPAVAFILLLFTVPESPRWLAQHGREDEAHGILERIGGKEHAATELAAIRELAGQEEGRFSELFIGPFRRPLILAVLLMASSQFCGINAIIYYSTDIFASAGGSQKRGLCRFGLGGFDQPPVHLRSHWTGGQGRPPALVAHRHRRADGGIGSGGLDVPYRSKRHAAALVRPAVHRRLCHGAGAHRVAVLFGNLPQQNPRARHVPGRFQRVGLRLYRHPDFPHAPGQPAYWPCQNLLDLCRVKPLVVLLCSDTHARNQGPHVGGNRAELDAPKRRCLIRIETLPPPA